MPPDDEPPVRLPAEAMPTWLVTPARLTDGRRAKHALADATRHLINAVLRLGVDALDADGVDTVRALGAEVEATAARVAALPRMRGSVPDGSSDDARLLERSGIAGAGNPLSAPLHLQISGDRVVGWAEYAEQYEGPPGCVHGGFVAAAFDDLLGAAQTLSGQAGFTGTLTIRMVRPTPLGRRIDYEGGVAGVEGRKLHTWGRARCVGEVVAEAEGVFIAPRPDAR
jgi:acyl-coenzyme A thioesterase PaaI-like protein